MELVSLEQILELLRSGILEIQPTQRRICLPIIQRIYHKMKIGVEFDEINVCDGLLINGNHRYLCSLLLEKPVVTRPWTKPTQISIYLWPDTDVDLKDWEADDIIQRHNGKDAARSGLDIRLLGN